MAINVRLLDHTSDPARSLYVAYRTAYSALTPQTIVDRIESERITREQMLDFIEKRLETGHASPLEQVWFEFAISGVTRAFSHQFVRHHIGISFEQQSQRYVAFKKGEFPYTVPDTVRDKGFAPKMEEVFAGLGDWQTCPIGKKRPHTKQLFELFDAHRRGELAPLADDDFRIIEEIGSSVATAGGVKASSVGAPPTIAPNGDHPAEGTPTTRDEG